MFSVLDVLDLAPTERQVFLEIARSGPQTLDALAQTTALPRDEISAALDALLIKNRLRRLPDDCYDVVMGKTKTHTTLPAQLWPALLAPQRLYSEQEIAILKVAIPMLEFVRATLSSFADHGPHHALRVKTFATQLGYVMGLTDTERRLLRVGALFHDIGNVVERERHHQISQETVEKLTTLGELPLSAEEVNVVGLLCRWHRKEYEPERVDLVRGENVRTGLCASILRVSDAMDIDSRRSDYDKEFRFAMEFFFPEKRQYFTSLEETYGVRVVCASDVNIQVFTRGMVQNNIQIEQLFGDLSKTPLAWRVQQLCIPPPERKTRGAGRALLVFPFDAHSLVMAALSRTQLERAGYAVELLCYPDTPDGASWLWRTALNETDTQNIAQLVVIGDRPDANVTLHLFNTVERWQSAGARIHILNRHEANWARVPELRARGVSVTLGTDWAYFWGNEFTREDFAWAALAALTTRDPTMASLNIAGETERVMQGLLDAVFEAETHAQQRGVQDSAAWLALAEPLLERIAQNDRAYFAARADEFRARVAMPRTGRVEGSVLILDATAVPPEGLFWTMEAAMEQHGFFYERNLRLRVPYAIATRAVGEHVELVAVNHWRANQVTPIRLLYPDIGPRPQGTESTVSARLTKAEAEMVVAKLIEECNK
jgi:hypothetical protein